MLKRIKDVIWRGVTFQIEGPGELAAFVFICLAIAAAAWRLGWTK